VNNGNSNLKFNNQGISSEFSQGCGVSNLFLGSTSEKDNISIPDVKPFPRNNFILRFYPLNIPL
jgi:hypothetical protein